MNRLIRAIALSLLMLLHGNGVFSYDFKINGIYYGYDSSNQSVYVTSGEDYYYGIVTIPKTIDVNGRTLPVKKVSGFEDCTELEAVIIPEGVIEIESGAFYNCCKLTEINLPKSLEELGGTYGGSIGVFAGCSSLTSIIIPDGVKEINRDLFSGCISLINVDLGNGVEIIHPGAFADCTCLQKITIPQSVNVIYGNDAFSGCVNLDTIIIADSNNRLRIYDDILGDHCPKVFYLGRNIVDRNNNQTFYMTHFLDSLIVLTIGSEVNDNPYFRSKKLSKIYSMQFAPPIIGYTFDNSVYLNSTLYVPTGSKNNYLSAPLWMNFFNIQEMDVKDMWNGGLKTYIAGIKGDAVSIHNDNGMITFSGVSNESTISIYSQSGILIDSSKASERSVLYANLRKGEVVIIKIDNNTFKIAIEQ